MLLGICLHQAPRPSFLAIAALEIHRAIFSDRGDYVHGVKWIVNFLHTKPWGKLLLPNGIGIQLGHDVINDRGADSARHAGNIDSELCGERNLFFARGFTLIVAPEAFFKLFLDLCVGNTDRVTLDIKAKLSTKSDLHCALLAVICDLLFDRSELVRDYFRRL